MFSSPELIDTTVKETHKQTLRILQRQPALDPRLSMICPWTAPPRTSPRPKQHMAYNARLSKCLCISGISSPLSCKRTRIGIKTPLQNAIETPDQRSSIFKNIIFFVKIKPTVFFMIFQADSLVSLGYEDKEESSST